MTCSISKGFVTYYGSLECEINYKLQLRDKRLALNHEFMSERVLYSTVFSSTRLELVIIMLVSSAKSTIFEFVPAIKGKSFM
jgi:hypothetical protein